MCQKAKDIQDILIKTESGNFIAFHNGLRKEIKIAAVDFFWDDGPQQWRYFYQTEEGWEDKVLQCEYFWVPTQNQLQQICTDRVKDKICEKFPELKISAVAKQFFEHYEGRTPEFESFEEAWLKFTMKTFFNKIWSFDKEDWVKR